MQEQEKLKFFEVAHEGAFVRAMAEAVANGVFSGLREFAPRSIVAVCGDDASRHAAEIVSALSGPLSIPVVVTDQLPVFCGALDVVFVTQSAGQRTGWGAEAFVETVAREASRRGSLTFCCAPHQWEDAPRGMTVLPNLPGMEGRFSAARVITSLWAIVAALDTPQDALGETLAHCAESVDEELHALSPQRDALVNPARGLRNWAHGTRVCTAHRRQWVYALRP